MSKYLFLLVFVFIIFTGCESDVIDPCSGLDCGSKDGVSCGSCFGLNYCNPEQQCEPVCDNMECGNDNGISCGTCAENEFCGSDNQCKISNCEESGCENDEICFHGACFEEADKAMGVKTLHIIDEVSMDELVDGDSVKLKIQVVLSGTDEMKEAFSEESLKEIVGPISNENIVFEVSQDGVESTLSETEVATNEFGIAIVDLSAINTTDNESMFSVIARTSDCADPIAECSKRFSITVNKRTRSLSLVSNTDVTVFTNSSKVLMARVTTNGVLAFANQDVSFKITGTNNNSKLESEKININGETITETANELVVKTDYAGIARIKVNASDGPANFNIDVSTISTTIKTFAVKVLERNGGCFQQSDCEALGEAYQCKNQVCVFVPIPCETDATCPIGFECKENPSGGSGKVCVEKPYICGQDNLDLESCRCVTDLNCPEELTCVRGRCVAQDIACTENIDCPNGLVCRNNTCQPNHTECKADANCFAFYGPGSDDPRCATEDACLCREGLCVNPCPDTEYIELSGGSGASCITDNNCDDNEVCFTGHGLNKCISKWDTSYYLNLTEALPPVLQTVLNGIGQVFGPISDILLEDDIDWGLPGWLSWLDETIVLTVRPLVDQFIPLWAQNLIIALNDTIIILQEVKVKVAMSFVHDPLVHSKVKGIEIWESFYIPWQGSWTEVKSEFGDEFQVNSSEFTGSIACQLRNGEANYSLYIDEHNAEFYFGKFVSSFLNGVLVPATTNNQYYDLSEAVRGYINCEKIAESVVNTIANLVGDWASGFITVSTFEGICETNVNVLVSKIDDYINELHVNDTAGGSDVFKFAGIVEIETRNTEAIKLKNGSFTGSLNLGEKRFFTGTWDAKKVK